MTDKRIYILSHDTARKLAAAQCMTALEGYVVRIGPPTRSLEQSAKFHAICGDISKSGFKWGGKARTAAQWKVLLVSGHAIATGEGSDVLSGLEGEMINLRESTALMSKKRGSSLIEYSIAFCSGNDIKLSDLSYNSSVAGTSK